MHAGLGPPAGVRRRLPHDDAFIEALAAVAFDDFSPRAGPRTLGFAAAPSAETWVAVRGEERLGFVVVEPAGDAVWIQAIAVSPSERGRGVGGLLMRAAEHAARTHGAPRLRLTTAQANVEALELFYKHGFAIERRLPRYYARGQDACVLGRVL